jgi:peptide/nickel transport system substrate-binding protein
MGNYLSQITPMPLSWDRSATSANGGCATGLFGAATTIADCKNVEAYLDSINTSTTFTSAFWQGGVDGPYRLASFTGGNVNFVPNATYSGPVHAHAALDEVAYTSSDKEFAALQSGALDEAAIDLSRLSPTTTKAGVAGPNATALTASDNLEVSSPWAFNEITPNYDTTGVGAALLAQTYIRQALQEGINQSSMIQTALRGYGVSQDSPLPVATLTSDGALKSLPTSYNMGAARSLLLTHGWTIGASSATCTSPGTGTSNCGAGIPAGTPLTFTMVINSNDATLDAEVASLKTTWSQLGVTLTTTNDTATNVASECGTSSTVSFCATGDGWTYANENYPSGDELFGNAATSNLGGVNDPTLSSLIATNDVVASNLTAYATYCAASVPVLYLPQAETLLEVSRKLTSLTSLSPNPLGSFNPEYLLIH